MYTHYGYKKGQVGQLYIAGFASSAVFGTFVAGLADKYGRRSNVLIYCITYILSCVTKHFQNFWMLFLGRILGGIAYSILFSAFESWMVYEHNRRGFSQKLLADTFSKAQFGNGLVAIVAGLIAGVLADRYGKVMPFDASILTLCLLLGIVWWTWSENYGDCTQSVTGGFKNAWKAVVADEKIVMLGIIQSAFEGAMYTFTFVWTPALQDAAGNLVEIPHGLIFSTFMAATMIGSSLLFLMSKNTRIEVIMRNVCLMGVLAFGCTVLIERIEVMYGAFLVFEVLCGIYFPGMATMRAPYVPEEQRSALLTFFRIPLNFIVVIALYEDLALKSVFKLCTGLMIVATIAQQRLISLAHYAPENAASDDELPLKDVSSGQIGSERV